MSWKIYKHTLILDCPSKGKSYIGQTSIKNPNKRWANGIGYSKRHPIFYNAIKKYGWENFSHEILEDNILTLEEANEREIKLIADYHTWIGDPNCWGYNTSKGGSGRAHKQTAETKQKISKALAGRVFTEEHKAKLSAKLKRKPIICIETNKVYCSQAEAARQTGISRYNIRAALKGKRTSAGGYHWADYYDIKRQLELKKLNGRCKPTKVKIICVETGEKFESISAAAKSINVSYSAIALILNKETRTAKGYHWKKI